MGRGLCDYFLSLGFEILLELLCDEIMGYGIRFGRYRKLCGKLPCDLPPHVPWRLADERVLENKSVLGRAAS